MATMEGNGDFLSMIEEAGIADIAAEAGFISESAPAPMKYHERFRQDMAEQRAANPGLNANASRRRAGTGAASGGRPQPHARWQVREQTPEIP